MSVCSRVYLCVWNEKYSVTQRYITRHRVFGSTSLALGNSSLSGLFLRKRPVLFSSVPSCWFWKPRTMAPLRPLALSLCFTVLKVQSLSSFCFQGWNEYYCVFKRKILKILRKHQSMIYELPPPSQSQSIYKAPHWF